MVKLLFSPTGWALKLLWKGLARMHERHELGWHIPVAIFTWFVPHLLATVVAFIAGWRFPLLAIAAFAVWTRPEFRGWATRNYATAMWRLRWSTFVEDAISSEPVPLESIAADSTGNITDMVIAPKLLNSNLPAVTEKIQKEMVAEFVEVEPLPKNRLSLKFDYTILPNIVDMMPSDNPLEFVLGVGRAGRKIVWKPAESPHLGIFGKTGGGKTNLLELIIQHALVHNGHWETPSIVTGKPTGMPKHFTARGVKMATVKATEEGKMCPKDMLDEIEDAYLVMTSRLLGSKKSGERDYKGKRILVAIDDMDGLLGQLDNSETKAFNGWVRAISNMGRSAGVHLIVMTQKPDVEAVGGGRILSNLARIVVPGGSEMSIKQGLDEVPTFDVPNIAGRVMYKNMTSGDSKVYDGQVSLFDESRTQPQPQRALGDDTSSPV